MSRVVRKSAFFICENKDADQLPGNRISAFVFATYIEQSLYFQHPNFQASSDILWLYSPVCVGPGQKPRKLVISQLGSNKTKRSYCRVNPKKWRHFCKQCRVLSDQSRGSLIWVCTLFAQACFSKKLGLFLFQDQLNEWANMTGFLCALGGVRLQSKVHRVRYIKDIFKC